MTERAIRYGRFVIDKGEASVVVVCTECHVWRVMRGDRVSALQAAAHHEESAHPRDKYARNALSASRRREV
jgi:hypothetical protein